MLKHPEVITEEYLDSHPEFIFVFGDNLDEKGLGGAAKLRYHKQALGFLTKKHSDDKDESFFRCDNYIDWYLKSVASLRDKIKLQPDKTFLISKLGAGLANRYGIFEKIIEPTLKSFLSDCQNVEFLW